jgi:hypothetical protein
VTIFYIIDPIMCGHPSINSLALSDDLDFENLGNIAEVMGDQENTIGDDAEDSSGSLSSIAEADLTAAAQQTTAGPLQIVPVAALAFTPVATKSSQKKELLIVVCTGLLIVVCTEKKHDPFQIIGHLNHSLKSLANSNQDSSKVLLKEKE